MRGLVALTAALATFATGCLAIIDTGGGGQPVDAGVDTRNPGCPDHDGEATSPYLLRLPVPSDVDLVAVQDGDGPWQVMSPADGYVVTEILGPRFAHAAVCAYRGLPAGFPPAKHVTIQFRTPGDVMQHDGCLHPPMVQLTANVSGGGARVHVFAGDSANTLDNGPFVPVPAGSWDIAVLGEGYVPTRPGVLAVQRDVVLDANGSITVDLARDGVDLRMLPELTADTGGFVDDLLTYASRVVFASGTRAETGFYDSTTPASPIVPPSELLEPDDQALVELGSTSLEPFRRRGHQRPIFGQPDGGFVLPPYPEVTVDANGVEWTGELEDAKLVLGYSSQAQGPTMYFTLVELAASGRWMASAGTSRSLPRFDPRTLPGWDSTWMPPPTRVSWELTTSTGRACDELAWTLLTGANDL